MRVLLLTASLTVPACLAFGAQARLVSQKTDGAERVCLYEGRGQRTPGKGDDQIERRVGIGQPCPRSPIRESQPTHVPNMATLKGERQEGNRRFCVYTYLGRDYIRPISIGSVCTWTPN